MYPSCAPAETVYEFRTFLTVAGIATVPIVGVTRASCWLMKVSGFRRVAEATIHSTDINSNTNNNRLNNNNNNYNNRRREEEEEEEDYSDYGKFCYGVFLGILAEMLLCFVTVGLQLRYPSVISIDIEITILFIWPLIAVARAGLQRWICLDFPDYDGRGTYFS